MDAVVLRKTPFKSSGTWLIGAPPSPQPSPKGRGSDALTPALSRGERERCHRARTCRPPAEAIRIWFDEVGRVGIFDRKAGHSSVFTEGGGGGEDRESSPRTDDDILARIIKQIEIWSHEETMEGLRLIVEDSVSPQVWDVLGGAATMRSREASLVVRATPGTQREVESLLNRLLATAQE